MKQFLGQNLLWLKIARGFIMSIDAILEKLVNEVAELRQEIHRFRSEKDINEDPTYAVALNEAKKGNYKPLQLYAKRRFEGNSRYKK